MSQITTYRVRGYQGASGPTDSRPVITSIKVERGYHDVLHIWNRGGKAGTLVVEEGDGDRLLDLLLPEREVWE